MNAAPRWLAVLLVLLAACGDTGARETTTTVRPPAAAASRTTQLTTTTSRVAATTTTPAPATTTGSATTTTRGATTTRAAAATPTTTTIITTTTTTTTTVPTTTTTLAETGGSAGLPTVFDAWTGGGDDALLACEFDDAFFGQVTTADLVQRGYLGLGGPSQGPTIPLGVNVADICIVQPPPASAYVLVVESPDGAEAFHPLRFREAWDGLTPSIGVEQLLRDGTVLELAAYPVCPGDCVVFATSSWFQLRPELPTGRYTFTLLAGTEELVASYDFRPSTSPWIQTDEVAETSTGALVTVLLSGFAPNQTVPLGLYRLAGDPGGVQPFSLVRGIGSIAVNRDGWVYAEATFTDLEPGVHYCISSPDLAPVDCSANYGSQIVFVRR